MTNPTNLPLQLTSFVGREREIGEVKRLLATTRLLTLTGSGGCGKTRLALHVGAEMLGSFPNGVWFVDLAPLSDASLVPQAIADVFDLHHISETFDILLQNFLRSKNLLLVLDNCEHLIQACAQMCDTLLRACPSLKILATSREALGEAGETAYRVPSLAVADPQHLPPVESMMQYEAVRLFTDRAISAQSTFSVNDDNARAVAQICHRLGGIPLALELAAARVNVFSAEEIALRLDDRLRLLTGGGRTSMPRHQTLRAAMDWSYNLLVESEQILFRRLSIFAGGWTLGAAEFVCADSIPPAPPSKGGLKEGDILEWHSHLIGKSLVLAEEKKGTTRYRMPETIRQYAHEKLEGSDEGERVRKQHLEYFMKFTEGGEPKLQSAEQKTWLEQLELEHDNLRAAFEWGIVNDAESALRLACSVQWWWSMRGQLIEGREWTTRLLARIERFQSSKSRARAYNLAGFIANRRRDFQAARELSVKGLENARSSGSKQEIALALQQMGVSLRFLGEASSARPFFEESLEMYRALEDERGIAYNLIGLGGLAIEGGGDYLLAQSLYEKSIGKYRSIGDQFAIRVVLNSLGELARVTGDYQSASAFYEEAVGVDRAINDKITNTSTVGNWAFVTMRLGDLALARKLFEQTLRLSQEQGDIDMLTLCVAGLAGIIGAKGEPEQAARLFGAVETARENHGVPMQTTDRLDYEHMIRAVQTQLDEASFRKAWTDGRAMKLEQAVEYAVQSASASDASIQMPRLYPAGLTEREVEVLRLIAQGLTDAQVGEKLVISTRTVNSHLRSIYSKIGVTTRTSAARFAMDNKLT